MAMKWSRAVEMRLQQAERAMERHRKLIAKMRKAIGGMSEALDEWAASFAKDDTRPLYLRDENTKQKS